MPDAQPQRPDRCLRQGAFCPTCGYRACMLTGVSPPMTTDPKALAANLRRQAGGIHFKRGPQSQAYRELIEAADFLDALSEKDGRPESPSGAPSSAAQGQTWWWLAELGPHGYSKPIDGPHDSREGVEEAAYLMARLGLQKGRTFVCAEIIETPVAAKPHDANEDALNTLNSIGLRP